MPREVFAGSRVIMVSCGNMHTMAVTADGLAWTCGLKYSGQLGLGDRISRLMFTQVSGRQLGGVRIVMMACGAFSQRGGDGGGQGVDFWVGSAWMGRARSW